jgi:hypothetical protein
MRRDVQHDGHGVILQIWHTSVLIINNDCTKTLCWQLTERSPPCQREPPSVMSQFMPSSRQFSGVGLLIFSRQFSQTIMDILHLGHQDLTVKRALGRT